MRGRLREAPNLKAKAPSRVEAEARAQSYVEIINCNSSTGAMVDYDKHFSPDIRGVDNAYVESTRNSRNIQVC